MAEATQLAWRASVDNILAATVKYAGLVMNCAAPVYADAPVGKFKKKIEQKVLSQTKIRNLPTPSRTWLRAAKDLTSWYGLSEENG